MAQDLYQELDRINNKLARLQEAVKVAGVYDKNADGVKKLLSGNNAIATDMIVLGVMATLSLLVSLKLTRWRED